MKDTQPLSLPSPDPGPKEAAGTEVCWLSAGDGSHLAYRLWSGAPGAPVLVYLHGIEGHGQWFEPSARQLNRDGFTIYAPDRRGAGLNQQERGHSSSYHRLLKDLEALFALIDSQHKDQPLFLLGNCWGAKAAILLACERPERFRGLILTCPALKPLVDMRFATKLTIAWCWLTGSRRVFPIPIETGMFTDNPFYLDYLRKDPLRLTAATAGFFVETLKLRRAANSAARKLKLPLLVLQSGKDAITDKSGTERWFASVQSEDKTLTVLEGSAHTLDFEADSSNYVKTLADWMAQRGGESRL